MGMSIDQIRKGTLSNLSREEYHFPTIDFKFQNTGNATAVLWRFVIDVLHAEVDGTPVLDFEVRVDNNEMQIIASNYGWGAAYECKMQINEPTLNELFTETARCYIGTIDSGEHRATICLSKEQLNVAKFNAKSINIMEYLSQKAIEFMALIRPFASKWAKEEYKHLVDYYLKSKRPSVKKFDDPKQREQIRNVLSELAKGKYRDLIDYFLKSMCPLIRELDDPEQCKQARKALIEYILNGYSSIKDTTISGRHILIIENPQLEVVWKCKDNKNVLHEGTISIPLVRSKEPDASVFSILFLTEDGFYCESHTVVPCAGMTSSSTYISIIDPLKGPHECIYPLSRQIPAGDVERFHIMIGSPMSCQLLLRFKFLIDQETISESETFDIKIWNPRNSRWHEYYKDGTELNRGLSEVLQETAEMGHWGLFGLKTLLDISNYPFGRSISLREELFQPNEKIYTEMMLALEQFAGRVSNIETIYYCKGYCLQEMQRYEEALQAYEEAISLNPSLVHAWYQKGSCLQSLHRYQEALQAYEQAIRCSPHYSPFWLEKGKVLQLLGRSKEASRAKKKAKQLDRSTIPGWMINLTLEAPSSPNPSLHVDVLRNEDLDG